MLISWGDKISEKDSFGFNNDYNAIVPISKTKALLWTNHEYVNPLFLHGETDRDKKSLEQIKQEMYNVGGSIVEIQKGKIWSLVSE